MAGRVGLCSNRDALHPSVILPGCTVGGCKSSSMSLQVMHKTVMELPPVGCTIDQQRGLSKSAASKHQAATHRTQNHSLTNVPPQWWLPAVLPALLALSLKHRCASTVARRGFPPPASTDAGTAAAPRSTAHATQCVVHIQQPEQAQVSRRLQGPGPSAHQGCTGPWSVSRPQNWRGW